MNYKIHGSQEWKILHNELKKHKITIDYDSQWGEGTIYFDNVKLCKIAFSGEQTIYIDETLNKHIQETKGE